MAGIGVIPEKTINYKLYIDGSASQAALVDADLPEIKMMSDTISGAGMGRPSCMRSDRIRN